MFAQQEPSSDEKREVAMMREMREKRRAGPFWTGSKEQWAKVDAAGEKRNFDMFGGAETYGNKSRKKPFQLADLKKVKAVSNSKWQPHCLMAFFVWRDSAYFPMP